MATVDDEIRRLLRRIDDLERSIDSERGVLQRAEDERRKFERRRGDVESARTKLTKTFDDEVNAVRSCQKEVSRNLGTATVGLSHEAALVSSIEGDLEPHIEYDSYGGQMLANLDKEKARCESEIQEAAAREATARGAVDRLRNQRAALVREAKQLADQPDATVWVTERTWY